MRLGTALDIPQEFRDAEERRELQEVEDFEEHGQVKRTDWPGLANIDVPVEPWVMNTSMLRMEIRADIESLQTLKKGLSEKIAVLEMRDNSLKDQIVTRMNIEEVQKIKIGGYSIFLRGSTSLVPTDPDCSDVPMEYVKVKASLRAAQIKRDIKSEKIPGLPEGVEEIRSETVVVR